MTEKNTLEKITEVNSEVSDEKIISKDRMLNFGLSEIEMKKKKKYVLITFIFLGFAIYLDSQIEFYSLDLYTYYLPKDNISSNIYIPFASSAFAIIVQIYFLFFKRHSSFKNILIFSLIISMILYILIPIFFKYLTEKALLIAIIINLLIQGFFSGLIENITLMLISNFPKDLIIWYSFGKGVVGIFIGISRIIFLLFEIKLIESKQNVINSWVIFGFAFSTIFIELLLIIGLYYNEYFMKRLLEIGEIKKKDCDKKFSIFQREEDEQLLINGNNNNNNNNDNMHINSNNNINKSDSNNINNTNSTNFNDTSIIYILETLNKIESNKNSTNNSNENTGPNSWIIQTFKSVWQIDLLILLNNIITFSLFPGICLEFNFFGIENSWKTIAIVLTFNITNTIGRKIPSLFNKLTLEIYFWNSFPRIIIFFIIFLNLYFDVKYKNILISIFTIFSLSILGITDGITNSIGFAIAPQVVENDNLKEKVGSSVCAFNIFGIFLGPVLSFGLIKIVKFFH